MEKGGGGDGLFFDDDDKENKKRGKRLVRAVAEVNCPVGCGLRIVFFKKMDDEREIVWRRNERGGSKFLPAIRGSAVGVRRRHVETNELRVWICFFA